MKLRPLVVLAIVALLWLAGCATVSFKRGAGPGGAKADEDACRAATTSPETYADCLRERGWMVSTAGSGTAPDVAPAEESAPTAAPARRPASAAAPAKQPPPAAAPAVEPAPADAGFVAPPAAPGTPIPPPAAPAAPAATGKKASAATTPPAAQAPSTKPEPNAAAPTKKPLDPTMKVTVSSWWKMGGTNADLDAAVKACVGELGPAHQPNVGPTEVTIALRDCLREKKWFAVGGTGGIGPK